ncbi:MAG: hypothetical protein CHACPFDD_01644 [Phycisphaerae bacterium]|nr:hypothetical protein [Phycisphaerae bacterium]
MATVHPHVEPPLVVVVAPVVNLTGGTDLDPLQVTDIIASEFVARGNISVVPVNLTLAALARRGVTQVESAAEAIELARELGADATVVAAVTEYRTYEPFIVGMVLQWYEPRELAPAERFDPVGASRAACPVEHASDAGDALEPRFQIQRTFNAAEGWVLEDVRRHAAARPGADGPYGWRVHLKSQDLFVRYCSRSLIETISTLGRSRQGAATETGT